MTVKLQNKPKKIKGNRKILDSLKPVTPLRVMHLKSQEVPERAWDVYAGVSTVQDEVFIPGRRVGYGIYQEKPVKAIRLLFYRGMGVIGQKFIPVQSLHSLEGDILKINSKYQFELFDPDTDPKYKTKKEYDNDWRILKQSGVLG